MWCLHNPWNIVSTQVVSFSLFFPSLSPFSWQSYLATCSQADSPNYMCLPTGVKLSYIFWWQAIKVRSYLTPNHLWLRTYWLDAGRNSKKLGRKRCLSPITRTDLFQYLEHMKVLKPQQLTAGREKSPSRLHWWFCCETAFELGPEGHVWLWRGQKRKIIKTQ
jgi:hypothetical protein